MPLLFSAPPLPTRLVPLPTPGNALADRLRPEADAVEAASHIDHYTHDFAILVVLERFSDGGQHDVQPEVVDGGRLAFEAVGPFAAVFVLGIFPFGADAFLEEMVIGLQGELGDGGDVVLSKGQRLAEIF